MYIQIGENKYPCRSRPGRVMVYMGLPEGFPFPVEGVISLCADNGFVLRTDDPADYLRQVFNGGVLTLTNDPEPEPVEPPPEVPPAPEFVTYDELAGKIQEGVKEA